MPKILIIEDEKVLLEVLEKKLTGEGYEVAVAEDGEAGIKEMRREKPDLVLLDIMMPKKDGFEVLADMKVDENLSNIPVIIISNSGQPVEIDKALKLGVKEYLIKTEFDPEEVLAKIVKVLGQEPPKKDKEILHKKDDIRSKKEAGGSNKIMVVEDDKFLRDLILKKLKTDNFETVFAKDGEEALKIVKEEKPSLILLDLILPGIDGFEVLKQIRSDQSETLQKIPVIILSNLGQKDDVEKGIDLGATDFMVKAHFTPGEIVDKIKEILKKK